jgi:hypothetical protein
MPCPPGTPDKLYQIMLDTWNAVCVPARRLPRTCTSALEFNEPAAFPALTFFPPPPPTYYGTGA